MARILPGHAIVVPRGGPAFIGPVTHGAVRRAGTIAEGAPGAIRILSLAPLRPVTVASPEAGTLTVETA